MSKTVTIRMPQLGESVDEGTIVKWLVEPGATVAELDAIVEVETDKVSTEVPSPVAGTVQALLAKEGDVVRIGAEIAILEVDEMAGVVTVASALTAPAATPSPTPLPSPAAGTKTGAEQTVAATTGDERVPLSRVRSLIAENITLSKKTIPHAWQAQEVDMTGVVANRQANKERFQRSESFSLTFLPYVIAAAIAGLRQHKSANATFMSDHVLLHSAMNIGIAVGLQDGVLVPVIRNADRLSVAGVARAANDLATKARAKTLTADDLKGGTFTVNNSGTFGTVLSYSVINPGQAGILTMGAVKERVVAIDGEMAIKPMMFLCFSLDHRILDGLEAARFLSTCREWLEAVTGETLVD